MLCVFITTVPNTKLFARGVPVSITKLFARGGGGSGGQRAEGMCYQRLCVCVLLLQDLLQSCARGGRRRVEDMCL